MSISCKPHLLARICCAHVGSPDYLAFSWMTREIGQLDDIGGPMETFRFTDEEWAQISAELSALGRLDCEANRWTIEMICWGFAALRPRLGRNRFVPTVARDAWLRVARTAAELDEAINGLRPAGAADFTSLDNQPDGLAEWSSKLSMLVDDAKWAAELEMAAYAPYDTADGSNGDPMLDGFIEQLVRVWEGFGGKPSVGYSESAGNVSAPLLRFLTVATTAALAAAARRPVQPLTPDQIQGIVRKLARPAMAC